MNGRSNGLIFPAIALVSALIVVVPGMASAQATPSDQHDQQTTAPARGQTETAGSTAPQAAANSSSSQQPQIVVPAGTHLPLVLHNSITTRNAQAGDPVYLESTFPVTINDHIVIPAGSYVQGEITEAKRPGKGKGNAEVRIRLTTLVLPNGYTVRFDAVPTNAGTGGPEHTDKEGKIQNDRDKSADAGTVIKTTGAGAGIGAVAGRSVEGAGIGAAAGAAAGLAAVLSMRGPELELPRGSSVDIMLDRPLYLDAAKINFSDPGRASPMPGPPARQPSRSFPF